MSEFQQVFKALSEENRINIINLLNNQELCGCELLEKLDISQSTLSHHMKVLGDAGLVLQRKDGTKMMYSLNWMLMQQLKHYFDGFEVRE